MTPSLLIRPLASDDSMESLTALLHRAYARLADLGLNFTATTQSVEVTRQRAAEGHCLLALVDGEVAGTITVSGHYDPVVSPWALQTPWFYRQDTAHFHQLAVDPRFQGLRIGDRLVAECEAWARSKGYLYMALDTAMPATHLRKRYQRHGYRDEGEVQWEGKTYRSVIMVKALAGDPRHADGSQAAPMPIDQPAAQALAP